MRYHGQLGSPFDGGVVCAGAGRSAANLDRNHNRFWEERRAMRFPTAFVTALMVFFSWSSARATSPPYLTQFPSVERVKAEIQGANAMETAARQMGAFWQLQEMIKDAAGPRFYRNQLTLDEKRYLGEYSVAYQVAGKPFESTLDRAKWYKLHSFYEVDDGFRDELLNRFFSPDFRAEYLVLKGQMNARALKRSQTAANARDQVQVGAEAPAGGMESQGEAVAATKNPPPRVLRPSGPVNSVVDLQVISETRQPIPRITLYLLDDDFEAILTRVGFQHQSLLGKELPLLNSFELLKRWMNVKENPLFSMLETMSGGSGLPEDVSQQYAIGTKALEQHTVATAKTDIYGKATFPALPAGTYYMYGTANRFVATGEEGTLSGSGNTVTLADTGYQQATIWNLKVTVRPGHDRVTLTPDNAAFTGD